MQSDDLFGVFEWGQGGIVHIHLLRWIAGRGRYDFVDGSVPEERRRRDARTLAVDHETELAEWDLMCPEKFRRREWDEDWPLRRTREPLLTDDESDGSGSDRAPSQGSNDPYAEASRDLDDDEQWARAPGGGRIIGVDGQPRRERVPCEDVELLKQFEGLLRNTSWHPAAIPLEAKRCLQIYNSRRVRRLRRWFLARLLEKMNQHDRHAGPPIEVPPVYGDDTASESGSHMSSEDTSREVTAATVEIRLMTWNVNAPARSSGDCRFLLRPLTGVDIACLQEMTPGAVDWLATHLGDRYRVIAPETCAGRAWPHEGHDVALVVDGKTFKVKSCKVHELDSDQQRCVFVVELLCRRTGALFHIATAHLESGVCEPGDLRVHQLRCALDLLERRDSTSLSVLAGDLNMREWESQRARLDNDGGSMWCDAWYMAGGDPMLAGTWQDKRYDRILWRRAPGGQEQPEYVDGSFELLEATESDHRGLRCSVRLQIAAATKSRSTPGLSWPLRRGARGRIAGHGVARRPTKYDACAKIELSTVHDVDGPKYYCGKCFEKPRIPAGEAALLEDERRRGLWRLGLSRNSPFINGFMVLAALWLCANEDGQVVTTAKGAADYVTKYITKYGAGQSVNARIGSIVDDIITRIPDGKTSTVASVLAKAFVATAVPDALCSLEAGMMAIPRSDEPISNATCTLILSMRFELRMGILNSYT